ncbi:hypothetical protein ACFOGJ_13365 [Marinibaculum pumilum]|uniref:T2SS protein K first SAM-like domain-containing protein n=1 Tax=Marinibaculum pumilum TaxID=1766165 RepID=A0ABV7L0Z5_9PROT
MSVWCAGRGRRAGDEGVAIIAALWAASLAAVIVISVSQLTRADAGTVRDRGALAQLHAATDAAINVAILAMLGPQQTQPPVTGRPFKIDVAGHSSTVTVLDEAGRIDLNRANAATLKLVLASAGSDGAEADDLVRRIMQHRTPPQDSLGGGGDSGGATIGYSPASIPFQTVGDLRWVPGMNAALYDRVAPLLTVYSQAADVDPTFATDRVLALFAGVSPVAKQALDERRAAARDGRPPPESPGVALGHAYTIAAEAKDPSSGAVARRTAVVRLTGQQDAPLLVYRWD